MTVAELMERVRGIGSQKAAARWKTYNELVRQAASGVDCDADAVQIMLDQFGKSEADFTADIAKVEKRIEYRRQLDAGPEARLQHDELQRQIGVLIQERDETIERCNHQIRQLNDQRIVAEQQVTWADLARGRLISSCDDRTISAEQKQLDAERREVSDRLRTLGEALNPTIQNSTALCLRAAEDELAAAEEDAALRRERSDGAKKLEAVAFYEKRVAEFRRRLAEKRQEHQRLQRQMADIEQRTRALEDRRLEP